MESHQEMRARGFPPIASPGVRVLILGSMPGDASLARREYYAHPRNGFWPIMGGLFGAGPERPYAERCRELTGHGVAVWDVIKSCARPGSLDADIVEKSITVNDFASFFRKYGGIRFVFFNGIKAERVYRRYVFTDAEEPGCGPEYRRLPSSSPANAALPLKEKLRAWQVVKRCVRK